MSVTVAPFALGQLATRTLVGADGAFYGVFGVFVVAFVVLTVVTVRWALRRDRAGRVAWRRRQQERHQQLVVGDVSPVGDAGPEPRPDLPQTNGHGPRRSGRRGRDRKRPG